MADNGSGSVDFQVANVLSISISKKRKGKKQTNYGKVHFNFRLHSEESFHLSIAPNFSSKPFCILAMIDSICLSVNVFSSS